MDKEFSYYYDITISIDSQRYMFRMRGYIFRSDIDSFILGAEGEKIAFLYAIVFHKLSNKMATGHYFSVYSYLPCQD